MTGIFPSAGISAPNTTGGDAGIEVLPGCEALFYRDNCGPRFDPVAMNYLISEIANAVNMFGDKYNCSITNNLEQTLLKLRDLCSYPLISGFGASTVNDFVAGCVDGVSGKIPIDTLLGLYKLCALTTRTPDVNDFLAGCFDDAEGKVTVQSIIDLTLSQLPDGPTSGGASLYRYGARITTDPNGSDQVSDPIDCRSIDGIYVQQIDPEAPGVPFNDAEMGNSGAPNSLGSGSVTQGTANVFGIREVSDGGTPANIQYLPLFDCTILKTAPLTWNKFNAYGIRGKTITIANDATIIFRTKNVSGNPAHYFFPIYKI